MYLTTESQMIVTPVDPAAFHEVRRYTVAPSTVYAQPIVLRNQVIVRDASSVMQWMLSPGNNMNHTLNPGALRRSALNRPSIQNGWSTRRSLVGRRRRTK